MPRATRAGCGAARAVPRERARKEKTTANPLSVELQETCSMGALQQPAYAHIQTHVPASTQGLGK
eukprot:9343197-Alexandrium_andersonii.AAC.1